MTWIKGFDFRSTSGYVTDPDNCTYELAEVYSTNRNGVTFGWSGTSISKTDRSTGVDVRLAGINQVPSGFSRTFRVDLPAVGDYKIRLAIGDTSGQSLVNVIIKDNATVLATLSNGASFTSNGCFWDATGVERTTAAWPGSNAQAIFTFASQILNFTLDAAALSSYIKIAHIEVEQVIVGLSIGELEAACQRQISQPYVPKYEVVSY